MKHQSCGPRRLLFCLSFLLCLQGCDIEITDPRFKPGDDPFVNLLFERQLKDANIVYRKDNDGFYVASEEAIEKMRALSKQAFALAERTSSLKVEPGCALDGLLRNLDEQGVVYFVDRSSSPQWLKTTAADAKAYRVLERSVEVGFACEKK